MLIKGYTPGSDITIMNCYYKYPHKNEETGSYDEDVIIIVYKDNTDGKKYVEYIPKPEYTYYKAPDNVNLDHNYFFVKKSQVEPVTCRFTDLEKSIAENRPYDVLEHVDLATLGQFKDNKEWMMANIREGNRQEIRKLHTCHNVFRSDMNIEDYYRFLFGKEYTNNIGKLKKSFFDIEVDTRWMAGDFVEMGECPINAIAFHDEESDTIYQFLLRDSRNPQIAEYEESIASGKFGPKQVKEFMTEAIGGWKQLVRYKLDKTKIVFKFYDEEINLIREFFQTVHKCQPDFCEGWNSSGFDISYLIARTMVLGYNPEDIMCDPSWKYKIVKHYVDQKNLSMLAERGDYTWISGVTTWIDQMIQFASRRKSKIGSFTSFKLDDIGKLIAKVQKLDYHHITNDIGMLPWLNFMVFSLYNIFDVCVQKCIELKTQDLEYIFAKCVVNNTSYKKGHRQTVYLINRMTKEFDKMGYIIGNNINKWNDKPEKFAGALVGDPLHTNDYSKMKINGIPIWVCETLQDYDYSSLYPSIDLENNIAPNTQIGRIMIDDTVYEGENAFCNQKYNRGGEFVENLVTDNIVEFSKRWLHLAGFKEFLEDLTEYMTYASFATEVHPFPYYYDKENNRYMMAPVRKSKEVVEPVRFVEDPIKPLYFIKPAREEKFV